MALDAVMVTPSHQYPLGGTMPLARRTALLAWARRTGTAVLEDDYDGEFRFDVLPLPALAALDPDVVLHVGTFAKSVSPWLRAGYLLVPPRHRAAVLTTRADLGQPVDGVTQAALAGYVASGALARHIARSRRDHAHRREHLLALLADRPALAPRGSSAGLHLVIELPDGVDGAAVVAAVAERGILLADLDAYRVRSTGRAAVVLGYGAARMHELDAAVAALAAAVDGLRAGEPDRPPAPQPDRG
jgi:GntR family transcriptional regulator/MocR family aminotransferase